MVNRDRLDTKSFGLSYDDKLAHAWTAAFWATTRISLGSASNRLRTSRSRSTTMIAF